MIECRGRKRLIGKYIILVPSAFDRANAVYQCDIRRAFRGRRKTGGICVQGDEIRIVPGARLHRSFKAVLVTKDID